MKTTLLLITILLTSFMSAYTQDITGRWGGVLEVPGGKLPLVVTIEKVGDTFKSTFFSPTQVKTGIPVESTSFQNNRLEMKIPSLGAEYSGELNAAGKFVGTFSQGGATFPLSLNKGGNAVVSEPSQEPKRPQEPKPPFSYYSEDVVFFNSAAKINLAGTLTLPNKEGKFPVVVLISGSGPQNRDEEILGHKPFLLWADYLTKNGIGVLRFDDRGVGKSEGSRTTATSADYATDVEAAVAYLKNRKEINNQKIGLIGHSEGGMIAPMVSAKSKDVAFIVSLAGTGISGDKILLMQKELLERVAGVSDSEIKKGVEINRGAFEIVKKSADTKTLESELKIYASQNGMSAAMTTEFVNQLVDPWLQFFIKYDPQTALKKVKVPVLAVNGEKDLQVPADANLEAIKLTLLKSGNKKVTAIKFPNLNHLFQECETGSDSEYGTIEQTISPIVLKEVTGWIIKQTKN